MTSQRLGRVVLLVALSGLAGAWQLPARQWIVTVMDDDHHPVTGLGSEDFSLKDGGARQPVAASEPETEPLTVALLVAGFDDTTQHDVLGAINAVSHAVAATGRDSHLIVLVDRSLAGPDAPLPVAADLAVTFPPTRRLSFAELVDQATSALARLGPPDRRAILALIRRPLPEAATSDLVSRLDQAHAPLWTVEVAPLWSVEFRKRDDPPGPRPAIDDALDAAVAVGGGWRWPVRTASELEAGAKGVAALLGTGQYVVTVNVPLLLNGPVPIATRHDRGIVLVPRWPR